MLLWLAEGIGAVGATRTNAFDRSSLEGSGVATMQSETVPARVARVAVRPGTGGREAWALGLSNARLPGYSPDPAGQVVFLKREPNTEWVLVGPPVDASGHVINPELGAFAIAADGSGWAVGDQGVLLHKASNSDRWVLSSQSGAVTTNTLTSVSLAPDGSGYASGDGPTILHLSNGTWSNDPLPANLSSLTNSIESIAAVSDSDAWAIATGQVTGVDSTSLLIFRKQASTWSRVLTNQAIFDNPPAKSSSGEINRGAEAGAVAADESGAWIGGKMYPRSASNVNGDATPGDSSRAFVLHYNNAASGFTSYCADQYSERTAQVDLTPMCDQPFPSAPFHIASISIVPGGDVFAGGLGLFHFSGGGWYREPDTNGYIISTAFGSRYEGYVASPGRSLGAGGLIRSSSITIGHWTRNPLTPDAARWAEPQDQMLFGIAADPSSDRAIAVGNQGAASIFSGHAWDSVNAVIGYALHGVAWPAGGTPFAVGQNGFILHLVNGAWQVYQDLNATSLYGVAFRTANEGVAVGLGGMIMSYRDGTWSEDNSSGITQDLYAITATSSGYVAVGSDGAVVEGMPGHWMLRSDARSALTRAGSSALPTLYGVAPFNGGVIVGGQDSALIYRSAAGDYRSFSSPLQGTVLSLGASGSTLYASVSPNDEKWRGEQAAAQRGTIMRLRSGTWTDVGLMQRTTLLRDAVDPSEFQDPIYDLAITSDDGGWGTGGSPADVKDSTGGYYRTLETSSVYKIASDPAQPASVAPVETSVGGISFAAFGESWCGAGYCSEALGTATQPDQVALKIRDQINEASLQPGGPRFVLYTGNMRNVGVPEELDQFKKYLAGFRIPVFAAIGNKDLFTAIDTSQAAGVQTPVSYSSNTYWQEAFADEPAPWGGSPSPKGFVPVTAGSTSAPAVRRASTHYAFDVQSDGKAALRVIVVDSSSRSLGNPSSQNPSEDQTTWLTAVLADATTQHIPTIVMMNQPTNIPSDQPVANWSNSTDQTAFEGAVTTSGVTAVITGGPRVNARDDIVPSVPGFIVGGGGAPLGRDPLAGVEPASKLPTDGYYHAWHLMRVDSTHRNLLGQAAITDAAYPVAESLAMHSYHGSSIVAGNTTEIDALARGLNGGFSDPDQSKSTYLVHGRSLFVCNYKAQGNGYCISGSAILPRFRFYSEDPSKADFVKPAPTDPTAPFRVGGNLMPDPGGAFGLLCVFDKLGDVGIDAIAGTLRARFVITVTPGTGPCITTTVPPVKITPTPSPAPPVFPSVVPHAPKSFIFFSGARVQPIVVFPPPPAPVIAPAPPGAPGVGRKEEHEVEVEHEKHSDASFTAIRSSYRKSLAEEYPYTLLIGVTAMALFGAAGVAAFRRRRVGAFARAQGGDEL
ncbi:MAG: hypothetical protein ACYDCC_01800 [Actinomycetota bacterium]